MTLGTKGCIMFAGAVVLGCHVLGRYNPWRPGDNTIDAIIALTVLAGEAWFLFG